MKFMDKITYLKYGIADFIKLFILYIPGASGRRLRYNYYRNKLRKCGKNVMIDEGVVIQNPEWISIGNNVWIDKYCILMAGPVDLEGKTVKRKGNTNFKWKEGELIIEDNVHIAPNCILQSHGGLYIGKNSGLSSGVKIYTLSNLPNSPNNPADLVYFTPLDQTNAYYMGPTILGENVGVALNASILSATIEKNSFVAPYSLVTGSFGQNSYIAGNPAKKTRERFTKKIK